MKHPETVEKYQGTLEQLAQEVSNLRYDSLAHFVYCLSENLYRQATEDYVNDRFKLGESLTEAKNRLDFASMYLKKAWNICKPYMKEE